LQLFKKAGYHLHLLGRPNQYYDVVPPAADLLYEEGFWSDLSQMQLMFGQRSAPLLSSAPAYDGAFSDYDKYSMAGGDAHTVEVELPALLKGKPQNTPGVYLFILDAAHDRYSWNPELPHDPLYRKIFEASTFNNHFTRNPQWAERGMQEDVLKAYRNSVRNIDKNIAGIFAQLKANNLYDNSIIVLFSDHGERLYESYGSWYEGMDYSDKWLYENIGHGGPAFNKVIDVGLVVKPHARFGKDDLLRTKLYFNMMSHQNIFPLLLEMADIDGSSPNPEDQLLLERINRKKILSAPHATNCQVSFSPNGSEDPYILAFVGENYKAMMHLHYGSYLMDEPDFSEVTFRVDAITNRNDVEITLGERSPELFFKEHFSSCLSAMGL
jgi:hypothetical protein